MKKNWEVATLNDGHKLATNIMNEGELKVATIDDDHEQLNETAISQEACEVTILVEVSLVIKGVCMF